MASVCVVRGCSLRALRSPRISSAIQYPQDGSMDTQIFSLRAWSDVQRQPSAVYFSQSHIRRQTVAMRYSPATTQFSSILQNRLFHSSTSSCYDQVKTVKDCGETDTKVTCSGFTKVIEESPLIEHDDRVGLSVKQSAMKAKVLALLNHTGTEPVQDQKLLAMIDVCVKLRLPVKGILGLVLQRLDILLNNPQDLNQCVARLLDCGFSPGRAAAIVAQCPQVVTYQHSIDEILQCLGGLGFRQKEVHQIVARCPAILSLSIHDLQVNYSHLLSLFRKSDVAFLILDCPRILMNSQSSVEAIFNYVIHEMGLSKSAMVHSGVFNFTLEHLSMRHLFLHRVGLFEKPDKHGNVKIDNVSLSRIVGDSDKTFACRAAGLTLPEYRVFQTMVQLEVQDNQDEDSDQDEAEHSYREM